jgi:Rps23 Pro-64 3,4-dihydroxylase Tpa1-like proline 4-hydroxylase
VKTIDRITLGQQIAARLAERRDELAGQWRRNGGTHCLIDDLLSPEMAADIHRRFPPGSAMMARKTIREHKFVTAQMDQVDPLLEEIVFGFQEDSVRAEVSKIVGLDELLPDKRLYAGGISMMTRGHFLNPHLDNSHDNDRSAYRVLNLLYYVSPGWSAANGGNLELWPQGPKGEPLVIESRFNRLVLMATHRESWHSVNPVRVDGSRCCVSNYYFSKQSPTGQPYFHVTTFRGRPEQPVRNLVLHADALLRAGVRKLFPKGVKASQHIYKK